MKNKQFFEDSVNQLSDLTKAIGHPARIQVLLYLKENGSSTCQNLVDALPYSQSTVSGHLQKLKDAGLIVMKSKQTSSIYSIKKDVLVDMNALFQSVFGLTPERNQLSLF